MEDTAKKRTIPATSVEASVIARRFLSLAKGETVTYDELSQLIGGDVRNVRWAINTAIKMALRENVVLHCVRGVGYMRPIDAAAVEGTERHIRKSARIVKRARRELHSVVYDELPQESKLTHQLNGAQLAALAALSNHRTRENARKRLEQGASKVDMVALLEQAKKGR